MTQYLCDSSWQPHNRTQTIDWPKHSGNTWYINTWYDPSTLERYIRVADDMLFSTRYYRDDSFFDSFVEYKYIGRDDSILYDEEDIVAEDLCELTGGIYCKQ